MKQYYFKIYGHFFFIFVGSEMGPTKNVVHSVVVWRNVPILIDFWVVS